MTKSLDCDTCQYHIKWHCSVWVNVRDKDTWINNLNTTVKLVYWLRPFFPSTNLFVWQRLQTEFWLIQVYFHKYELVLEKFFMNSKLLKIMAILASIAYWYATAKMTHEWLHIFWLLCMMHNMWKSLLCHKKIAKVQGPVIQNSQRHQLNYHRPPSGPLWKYRNLCRFCLLKI